MRLLLLTPAPDEPRFAAIASELAERLSAPLRPEGIEVTTRSWTEAGDLAGFDAVTPLLAWGYHSREREWRTLLDRLDEGGVRAVNSVEVLSWNTQKTYLAELEEAGAPIVPTLFVDRLTPAAVAEAHERFGQDLIVKPQVSGGSFGTIRLPHGGSLAGGPPGPAMLQPFLPAVAEEGELSLLYFGGAFSHAIAKVASAGDFRVQYQYGGAYRAIEADAEMRRVASQVLEAAGQPLAYARIDLIRAPDGELRLMELEAIEPDLYLDLAPDRGGGFAKAMRAAMR
ncbi:ATP-grasp domain-containing protein [Phenylobacterium montanum]